MDASSAKQRAVDFSGADEGVFLHREADLGLDVLVKLLAGSFVLSALREQGVKPPFL